MSTIGKFKYQANTVTKSVVSTGNVYLDMHMDEQSYFKTNETGLDEISVEKVVYDARAEDLTLDRNGACLVKNADFVEINFWDHDEICTKYYNALETFIIQTIPNVYKVKYLRC